MNRAVVDGEREVLLEGAGFTAFAAWLARVAVDDGGVPDFRPGVISHRDPVPCHRDPVVVGGRRG